ncbi:MAG TPA: ABC transporter substrate-binding protein, partial [Lachnospiraceae bacterium]|nr:ABC transporter substrate-binding protein [Lachnospiraceae bacterium]
GLDYVNTHTPEEIAKVIQPQFAETDKDDLVKIVKRYYDQQTWKDNTVFEEESFTLLQDILEEAGQLTQRAPYNDLVTTDFATKATK